MTINSLDDGLGSAQRFKQGPGPLERPTAYVPAVGVQLFNKNPNDLAKGF